MGRLNSIWMFIRQHKYAFATIIFLLIIGVVDENSLYVRYQRKMEIARLREQIDKYQAQYEADTRQLNALLNDPKEVEKVARERYFMKRANEDVFVFVDEGTYKVQQPLQRPADHPVPALPGETSPAEADGNGQAAPAETVNGTEPANAPAPAAQEGQQAQEEKQNQTH